MLLFWFCSNIINILFLYISSMAALHQAALTGSTDMMRLLLDAGSTIDIEDNKGTVTIVTTMHEVPSNHEMHH